MTRKKPQESQHSALEMNQYRLRYIANELESGRDLPNEAWGFLINALWRIGEGEDANVALGVKAKPGQRKTRESAGRAAKMRFALPWIASAIRPIDQDGLGLAFTDALDRAEKGFGLSADTLNQYWKDYSEMHGPTFQPPISFLPFRDKRAKK